MVYYAHNTSQGLLINTNKKSIKHGIIFCSLLEVKEWIHIVSIQIDEIVKLVVTFDESVIKY